LSTGEFDVVGFPPGFGGTPGVTEDFTLGEALPEGFAASRLGGTDFAESRNPMSSELSLPIEVEREFRIFEDAQSVAARRQLEEPLIFQGEIQQDVSRADAKDKEQKEDAFSNKAHGKEHRHKTESANARTEHGKESAGPIEQEQLEPGLSNFVDQQDAQRFGGADQKAERNGFVSHDELTMRHN
jgi:hypothetical protein